jgi:hypothetical protein
MLLLGWSQRYKNSTVVVIIWLTATKYPYHKWQWIFYFLRRYFLSFITAITFTGLDCINELHSRCLIRSMSCFSLHPSSPLQFCVVMSCYDFCIKTMFGLSLPHLFVGGLVLFMLFVFVAYSGAQQVLTIRVTWRVSYKRQVLLTLREHLRSPLVFGGVCVAHLLIFLCCPIMCLYVLNSLLWCPLWFLHGNDVQFAFASSCF